MVVHTTKYEKMYRCVINAGHTNSIIKLGSDIWTDSLNSHDCVCT